MSRGSGEASAGFDQPPSAPRPAVATQQIQKPRRDKTWEYRKAIAVPSTDRDRLSRATVGPVARPGEQSGTTFWVDRGAEAHLELAGRFLTEFDTKSLRTCPFGRGGQPSKGTAQSLYRRLD